MTNTQRNDFEGKVALVVGASRGIGAGVAEAFGAAGAAVAVAARDAEDLAAVAARIERAGGKALAVPTDVTDEDQVRALVERTVAEFGRLDTAFNNANRSVMPAPLADLDTKDFDRAMATSVRGTFLGMRHQIPAILETAEGAGTIVNMASLAGVQAVSGLAPYVAGKAGIIALTQVAALDYGHLGLRVNVVAPGPIDTHAMERAGEEGRRQAAAAVSMQRVGTVAEVAETVLWLSSPASSYTSGAVIPIDGGQGAGVLLRRRRG
ncbi:short-chain dehydrogenase [Mangrovactinospora gilvigrisea]|uniref:Short-chain dehydrogenase n=1 Tax=Mangrovactinospora gilvigrisea TaxID=1428644 RepID=A0A1J7B9S5_9ACTN|nr:short-chain dehydrogenase [Mangrovactinospora gilvigrisea]